MQFDGLLIKIKQCYRFEKKKGPTRKGHVVFRDLNYLSDMFHYRIKHVKDTFANTPSVTFGI